MPFLRPVSPSKTLLLDAIRKKFLRATDAYIDTSMVWNADERMAQRFYSCRTLWSACCALCTVTEEVTQQSSNCSNQSSSCPMQLTLKWASRQRWGWTLNIPEHLGVRLQGLGD